MRRRIGSVGLALVAVLALGAVGAQGAWASSFDYGAGTTKLVGRGGEQVFNAGGSKIVCSEVTWETTEFSSEEINAIPNFPTGKCTAFGFPVHITITSCHFSFKHFKKWLTCFIHSFHVTPTFLGSSVCTVDIGGAEANIGYDNSATAPMKLTITASTGNEIPFEEQAGGGCGAGSGNGSYTGNITVEGKNASGEQTDLTWTE